MPREQLDQHRVLDEQYILLIHNIPPKARWQELKDIAKDYCGQRVCYADTIAPLHTMGHVKINGLRNALKVYDEFRYRGWYGRGPLQVSLRGPVQTGTLVHGDLLSRLSEVRPVASYMGSESAAASPMANYPSTRSPQLDTRHDYRGSYPHPPDQTGNGHMPQSKSSSSRASTGRHTKMSTSTRRSAKGTGAPQTSPHYQYTRPDGRNAKHSASRHESLPSTSTTSIPVRDRPNTATPTGQDIQLSNIPSTMTDKQLCELLNRFGEARLSRVGAATVFARFRHAAHATAAVSTLHGFNCQGTKLVAAVVTKQPSSMADIPTTRDKRAESTASSQVSRGPLVVDGAKSIRPRYRDRRTPADSDTSDDDDSDEPSNDSDGTSGWSGSVDGRTEVR